MSRVIDAVLQLTDKFTSPMQKSIRAMVNAGAEGRRMRKSIAEAGKAITSVGDTLTKSLTLPVIGAGAACMKMAADFENGIAKVSTIADTSVMSLDKIRRSTIELSNQLGVSVGDISEAQYNAISAGAATEKSLNLVSTAIKAAKAGFTDTATAVDGLTTIFNSFQGAVDYGTIADQMLMTQNYGKTTFGEMASSIGQVTPVASSLNVSTNELFSSIAILTKNGINTSSAITGLKAAYSNILKPTSDASKAAKKLGLDFSATHLKAVGWAKFMAEIKEKTNGDANAMAKLFGSVEALNSMTVLAGAGMEDFTACLEQMNNAAGLTQQSYEKMLTPTERWNIALNKIKNSGIQIGEKLLPMFEQMASMVNQAADRFSSMSDEQVDSIIKIAAAAAAVGPAISMFGKLVTGVSSVLGVVAKLSKAGGVIKYAFAALASPAGIVIAVLLGIIAAGVLVYKNFDKIKASMAGFAQKCRPQIEMVRTAFNRVKTEIQRVAPAFAEMKERAVVMVETIKTALAPFVQFLKAAFSQGIQNALAAAAGFLLGFSTKVGVIIDGVMKYLNGLITFITAVFSGNWGEAWNGIVQIFTGIFETITGVAAGVINGVAASVNAVIDTINNAGFTIPEWVPVMGGKEFHINIPEIPMLAKGTDNWKGGLAQVNEKGGEIIDLPKGTRVYPHDESIRKARREGGMTVKIAKLADQIIVREDEDIDRIADRLVQKLKNSAGNMGGTSVADMA